MRYLLIFLVLILSHRAVSQSDHDEIKAVIDRFIKGTVYNYPDTILSSFYPGTKMFLYSPENPSLEMTVEEYAALYSRKEPGTLNNRPSRIVSIDQVLDVAYARVEVLIPFYGNRYNDLLLLKKFPAGWKIVSKCTSAEPIPKTPMEMVPLPSKEVVLDGLKRPWSMAFISETDVLIAEKDGDLVRVDLASKNRVRIKGLPEDVARAVAIDTTKFRKGIFPPQAHGQTRSFNAGWFQVLLDPDFKQNNYIYLSYAAENADRESGLKVIRGKLSGDQFTEVEELFNALPYAHGLFHYGGGMIFGSDKKLYITTGERNFQEYLNPDPPVAQDLSDPRGEVIRINRDGSIPDDNPDFGPDAVPGLFALGIRATQGLTINSDSGEIWFSEHGTMQGDELNILKAGANYGWPYKTSGKYRSQEYNPVIPEGLEFTDPIYFWDQTVAPTGLTFYYGKEFAQWNGSVLVPGLSKGSLWRVVVDNNMVISAEKLFINDLVRLRKAIVSPNGKLYLLTDEEDGKLIRVVNQNY